MQIIDISFSAPVFKVQWSDQTISSFPSIFLRDNDPDELHPQTRERIFDLTKVPFDIEPEHYSFEADRLSITWPDKPVASVYSSHWLSSHRPGHVRDHVSVIPKSFWDATFSDSLPQFSASACEASKPQMFSMLSALKEFGLVIVNDLADEADAGTNFGELIGFKRRNNFGSVFHVVNQPDPNNLAYTSIALPLHTDLSNQELIPGYQFFHCYRNDADGGNSTYADGFRISEDLRSECPEYFDILTKIQVPFRFHDHACDIRFKHPEIRLNENNEIIEFVFNAHLADVPDMPVSDMLAFYEAYQELMRRIRSDRYQISVNLKPGEMAILDNRRVMHGRGEFDPSSGHRQLQGYYIDHGELDSKLRLMSNG